MCKCKPSYVRPQPKQQVIAAKSTVCKTIGAQEFNPIGDVCSCGHVQVAPTPLGAIADSSADPPSGGCKCGKTSKVSAAQGRDLNLSPYTQYDISGTQFDEAANIYDQPQTKPTNNGPPGADPISIVLAAEQQDRCNHNVPEAKLHYGPSGKIEDGSLKVHVPDLNEGALYQLKGPRLSLKKCTKQQVQE